MKQFRYMKYHTCHYHTRNNKRTPSNRATFLIFFFNGNSCNHYPRYNSSTERVNLNAALCIAYIA